MAQHKTGETGHRQVGPHDSAGRQGKTSSNPIQNLNGSKIDSNSSKL
jgi:hypothetical protein